MKWSERELEILKNEYPKCPKQKPMEYIYDLLPNRTDRAIRAKAQQLNIKKETKYGGDISKLLEGNPESLYWIGFLMADGYFGNNKIGYRLDLTLSYNDLDHMKNIMNFLGCYGEPKTDIRNNNGKEYKMIRLFISNNELVLDIMNKFGLAENKTYNPPNTDIYKSFTSEDIMSIFIGLIDGDGTTRSGDKGKEITIGMHQNWHLFLMFMYKKLSIGTEPRIRGNMSHYSIYKKKDIQKMKQHIKKYNLPAMKRKWELFQNMS